MAGPLLLAIEIGGTKLQLAIGTADGAILALDRRRVEPAAGASGIRGQILDALPLLAAQLGIGPSELAAMAIGFGGPVEVESGRVLVSNQIDGWGDFPLARWATEALGLTRVAVRNDADTAALGESRFGAGAGLSPVVYLTIGSGIGGGLVVNGEIYEGSGRGTIEVGHLRIDGEGGLTLEQLASGWSIGREVARVASQCPAEDWSRSSLAARCSGDPGAIDAAAVAAAARVNDPIARQVLARATRAMGRALAQVVTILGPRRIILGGGVSLMGDDLWFQPIRREVESCVFGPFLGTYDIVPAALGETVVVQGALALAGDLTSSNPR